MKALYIEGKPKASITICHFSPSLSIGFPNIIYWSQSNGGLADDAKKIHHILRFIFLATLLAIYEK